jgi:hypothetical protein
MITRAVGPTKTNSVIRTVVDTRSVGSLLNGGIIGSAGSEYNGYVYSQSPADWSITLPDGTYTVEVAISCPSSKSLQSQSVTVQGVSLFSNATTIAGQPKTSKQTVTVTNGKLVMTIGNGKGQTYVSFIKITGTAPQKTSGSAVLMRASRMMSN